MSTFSTVSNDFVLEVSKNGFIRRTPSVDENFAYGFAANTLYALKTADGTNAFSILARVTSGDDNPTSLPVLSGKQSAFAINNGTLVGFDLATKSLAWKAAGLAVGVPVYAKDVVYVLTAKGAELEARSPETGALLWSSDKLHDYDKFEQLVVTDNLAFVSSADRTAAIDLNTRKIVWEYPLGGTLSISNRGVLYITGGKREKLAAINLE
ncbi:outer membrane protein assembly factor BamB family protein [Massilia pseudoviolaceinigra]|uniref:outer membrane protein assembly factor BamB family protein n=1 Tax=Massilia pseudoviolaceinigra TaxID=3057165 RepID=UPI00279663CD|nr:PQQ-binding-like beta-propeller repeat protein [Massilia sp. CCM 9206]MDQ1925090.1 PQQ-binding-like beta-propeller repeat protein [Massilia sp. CCM 9206]